MHPCLVKGEPAVRVVKVWASGFWLVQGDLLINFRNCKWRLLVKVIPCLGASTYDHHGVGRKAGGVIGAKEDDIARV